MKLKKTISWVLGGTLGVLVLAALGGYCWLYSWTWGSVPPAHSGFAANEVVKLQALDAHITEKVPAAQRETIRQNILEKRADEMMFEEGEDSFSEPTLSCFEEFALRLMAARMSRNLQAPQRESLHTLIKTGSADAANLGLAFSALETRDVELVKMLVKKGLKMSSSSENGRTTSLLEVVMCASDIEGACMPIEERLKLLDWLVEQGADIHDIPGEVVLKNAEASLKESDDECGALLDWFLRRGAKLDQNRAAIILLQHGGAWTVYQRLIQDNLLPEPPAEFVSAQYSCTPLQLAASAHTPLPEALRCLLELGHNANAVPAGAETPAEENDEYGEALFISLSPLDACLYSMRYVSLGQSYEEDMRLRAKLDVLDVLLQHGAWPGPRTNDCLPINTALEREIVELFRKHGFHLTAGEAPCNACCTPE